MDVSAIADQKMLIFCSSDFFRHREHASSNKSEGEKLKRQATYMKERRGFKAEAVVSLPSTSYDPTIKPYCSFNCSLPLGKDINSWVKNKSHKEYYKQPWSTIIVWFIRTQALQKAIIKYENINLSQERATLINLNPGQHKVLYDHTVFPSSRCCFFMTLREAFGWTCVNRRRRGDALFGRQRKLRPQPRVRIKGRKTFS